MKIFRRVALVVALLLLIISAWIWFNRPQRAEMSAYAPASALIYLETNSLVDVADGIAATDSWKAIKPLIGDTKMSWPGRQTRRFVAFTGIGPTPSVILSRAQIATVMLDLGTREEGETVTLKPEVALLIETHTAKRRIKSVVEQTLQTFAERLYQNPTLKRTIIEGDEFLVWTATDNNRQIVALIDDTLVIVANSDRAVRACLEARRGLRPNLLSNPELQQMKNNLKAGEALAFGFVPSSRSGELLGLATPVALGRAPGGAQVDELVARSAAKILSSAGWSARLADGAIEDHYFFSLKPTIVSRMRPVFESSGQSLPTLPFISENAHSVTVYSFKQPDKTWRELQTTLSSQLDTLSAVLLTSVLKAGLTQYGVDDPEKFLRLVGPEIATLRFGTNEGSSVLIARVRDEAALRELLKHPSQTTGENERPPSVHYQDGFVLLGAEEDLQQCIQSAKEGRRNEIKYLGKQPTSSVVTYSDDSSRVANFIAALARAQNTTTQINDAAGLQQQIRLPYSVTETTLGENGLERRTRSPLGQFSAVVPLIFPTK